MRIGGEERWIAAEDAGLYRDALGAVPPGGLPEAFLEAVEEPLRAARAPLRAHPRPVHHRRALGSRYGVDPRPVLRELERAGDLVRGELRPGGSEREWCDPEVLRRLRRASLASLRKEVEPAEQRALARFLPAWQGVDASPPGGAGVDRLREMLVPLQGLALTPEVWERDVLPRRVGAYSQAWMDQLCAGGELVWVGAGALGRGSGRRGALLPRGRALARPAAVQGASRPAEPLHDAHPRAARARRRFWTDLLADLRGASRVELQEALWDLVVGGRGDQRRLRAAARAAAVAGAKARARAPAAASRAAAARARRRSRAAGRSPRRCSPTRPRTGRACARSPSCCSSATGSSRARRCWPRACPAASPALYGELVEPRDARHRPPRLLRGGPGRRAVRAAGARSSGCAACAPTSPPAPLVLAATDPGQPLRRHAAVAEARGRRVAAAARRACRAPTWSRSTPSRCSTSSAAARACSPLREPDESWLRARARGAGRRGAPRPPHAPRRRALRRRAGGGLARSSRC